MPIFKVTWKFQSASGSTWNEVYLCNTSNISEAVKVKLALQTARLGMLHKTNRWLEVRASQLDAQRITGSRVVNLAGGAPGVGGPDIAGTSATCKMSTTGGVSRRLWLRGLADDFVSKDPDTGRDTPSPVFAGLLQVFFTALAAEPYGARRLRPKGAGLLLNNKITKVDGSAKNGIAIITLKDAQNYPYPGRVVIGGASKKDLPALNGHYNLLATPVGNTVQISYQTPSGSVVEGGNGYLRQEDYDTWTAFDPALCSFAYFGTRVTKNFFTGTRGARRAARIRLVL